MTRRISTQLIFAVTLISVVLFALLSYILISAQRRASIAQMERHSIGYIETISSSTRHAMMENRQDDLHQIVDDLGRQPAITRVRIFNKLGRIMYSSDDEEEGTVIDMQAEACFGCHGEGEPKVRLGPEDWSRFFDDETGLPQLGIIHPVSNEPACAEADCHAHPADQTVLGVLDLTLPLQELREQMAGSMRKAMLLTALTVFATWTIVMLFFHARVGKPVGALLAATEGVASGDLSTRIEVRRQDELGMLQRSFNEMTARLAETQTQLYQSNKLASVGRLAAGIAHEINNPLTGVLTFSSLLLRRAQDDPETRADLETIVNETKRCREIVKGLLDFSRQVPPRKTEVDINDVVNRAIDIVDHQFSVSNIKITRVLSDSLPRVRVDPNQIEQVLLNLLVNAADAVPRGKGEIFIGTDLKRNDDGQRLQIKVADNGAGIAPADREKLFDPFFSTKEGGTGLGLAIAWGIVNEHGGEIAVSSQPGKGATFTVEIPLEARVADGAKGAAGDGQG